jgi:sulfhydrogenase subunit beta (sulfur reductase)
LTKNFLETDFFQNFFEELSQFGIIHGPSLTEDGVPAFTPLGSTTDLCIDYRRTLIPPKKYLIPPRETILAFVSELGYALPAPAIRETILFGLHPCDLAAIAYLDRVFLEDRPDPLYQARRNAITLIGLSCEPDSFCFCTALGTDTPDAFDIYLEMVEGGFQVHTGSPRGEAIISAISCLSNGGRTKLPPSVVSDLAEQIRTVVQHPDSLPESPLWGNFADHCLSCGACSCCCPTCYCFDVRESGNLDGQSAERIREWDNCLLKSHGEVAGGYSFRKTRQERFRYRFLHKYLGFGPLRGVVSCVGCGRCREVCPVKIDLTELFQQQK